MIKLFLSTYVIEWLTLPWVSSDSAWYLALAMAYLRTALAMQMVFLASKGQRISHIVLFCVLMAYSDLINFLLWLVLGVDLSAIAITAAAMSVWLVWIYCRAYDTVSDTINPKNVMILLHRPTQWYSMAHSFLGLPFGSVCIMAGMRVWSFKKKSGRFEKRAFHTRLLNGHLFIDTGIPITDEIIDKLESLVGTSRGRGVRCVSTLRPVLEMLGEELVPRGLFWFVPGVFAFKVLKNRERLRDG
jgi:hypothetical protein